MNSSIRDEDPRHKRLCDIVEKHCEKHDCVVLRNYVYDEKGVIGEIDVLTADQYGLCMYEIKSKHTSSSYRKAREQFERFYNSHKDIGQSIRGIYVTPTRIRRL